MTTPDKYGVAILVWPTYFWRYAEECDEFYLQEMSDDFVRVLIDGNWDENQIEEYLAETKPQG